MLVQPYVLAPLGFCPLSAGAFYPRFLAFSLGEKSCELSNMAENLVVTVAIGSLFSLNRK